VRTDRTLYLDLELTCWDGPRPEGQFHEIIQVGVVEVDTLDLAITRKCAYYVTPEKSLVSEYCTNLTGITQRQVDRQGRPFYEVLNSITKKFGPKNKVCYTWGNDQEAVEYACDHDGLLSPFTFINLSHFFSVTMGVKSMSLEDALLLLNSSFKGRAHDALVDAENTAELHMAMIRRTRA
jgi:inhibitor of KinA sporulation pathway (predicted exonuclease)